MKLCEQLYRSIVRNRISIYHGLAKDRFEHHVLDVTSTDLEKGMVSKQSSGKQLAQNIFGLITI